MIDPQLIKGSVALASATLISEDLSFIYGLFSVKNAQMTIYSFILAYSIGVLVGDLMLYGFGSLARSFSDNKWVNKLLSRLPKIDKDQSPNSFGRFEEFLVFTRFIPGSRIPTYMYCGLNGYPLFKFSLILFIPTLMYSGLASCLIYMSDGFNIIEQAWYLKLLVAIAIALLTILIFKLMIGLRRLKVRYGEVKRPLYILIRRLAYPEFWPSFFFYLPLVPHFLKLLIKHKGFTAVLSSNPSISMSGLVGELKTDIDKLMRSNIPAKNLLEIIDVADKEIFQLDLEMRKKDISFPVILKPDSGMRGTDVMLINSLEELEKVLKTFNKGMILQKYYPYNNELGVFYYRLPDESKGHIFSITDKEFITIVGDGSNNMMQLLVQNKHHENRFNWIFSDYGLDPKRVLEKEESLLLTKRGSHSKGCIFRDGSHFLNEVGLQKIRETLDLLPGFNIGRADIRFESLTKLNEGHFKIIEINGAGAESSNYYDPQMSKKELYRIMKDQWSLIFKIGCLNKRTGAAGDSTLNFLKAAFLYRKKRS